MTSRCHKRAEAFVRSNAISLSLPQTGIALRQCKLVLHLTQQVKHLKPPLSLSMESEEDRMIQGSCLVAFEGCCSTADSTTRGKFLPQTIIVGSSLLTSFEKAEHCLVCSI